MYVAGLWFLVRFQHILGCFSVMVASLPCEQSLLRSSLKNRGPLADFSRKIEGDSARRVWLVMNEMSFAFWSSSWVSSKQMGRDIFFRLQRVPWCCWFSQRVNSNRGHKASLLVLTFTKYLEVAIVLFLYANVTRYFYFLLQRVTWHPCFSQGRKFN